MAKLLFPYLESQAAGWKKVVLLLAGVLQVELQAELLEAELSQVGVLKEAVLLRAGRCPFPTRLRVFSARFPLRTFSRSGFWSRVQL